MKCKYLIATVVLPMIAMAGGETPAPTAKPEPYELKTRSNFTLLFDTRTPFWPIGWTRPAPAQSSGPAPPKPEVVVKFHLKPEYIPVTSIMSGNPPLAIINGTSYAEGEQIPVMNGNQPLRVIVWAIRDGGVLLDHDGEKVFVPLRREKLPPNTPAPDPVLDTNTKNPIQIGPANRK